jgi:hypothetical protein
MNLFDDDLGNVLDVDRDGRGDRGRDGRRRVRRSAVSIIVVGALPLADARLPPKVLLA